MGCDEQHFSLASDIAETWWRFHEQTLEFVINKQHLITGLERHSRYLEPK